MVVQLGGALDAGYGVICSDLSGLVSSLAPNQSTNKGRGIDITGAMAAVCQLFVFIVSIYTVFEHHDAGLAGGIRNAGKDHVLAANAGEAGKQAVDIGPVILGFVFHTGEEAGLGDVGNHIVSLGAQTLHGFYIGHVEDGIEAAVVCHGGVYDGDTVFIGGFGKDLLDNADLPDAAQVAGIDGLEADVFLAPVIHNGGHILSQIPESEAGEAGSVGGKYGRGQYAGLYTASREDRQRNGQRTLTDTGNILNGENLLVRHKNRSFCKISHIIARTGNK